MPSQNVTLLLVEDDEVDAELVSRGLRRRSLVFDYRTATNGREALDLLQNGINTSPEHGLIVLLDLNMPGMNGHEFLTELRAHPTLKSTVVFVLTTSSLPKDKQAAYEKNVAGYFVKSNLDNVLDLMSNFAEVVEFPPAGLPQ